LARERLTGPYLDAMKLLAISGSLRLASSNSRVIAALERLAPDGVSVAIYRGLNDLPHFNPDLDGETPPAAVADLRRRVGEADGLIICSPEYAHGVAGVMKNALDWLVPSVEFPQIPVALINAAPHAHFAQDHIRETLTVMSSRLVEDACVTVPMAGRPIGPEEIAADPELGAILRGSLESLVEAVRRFGPRAI